MRRWTRVIAVVSLALGPVLLAGCQKKEEPPPPVAEAPKPVPFRIVGMELGKSLGADKKVAAPMATFGPRDTIYVAISSEGTATSTTVQALWQFQDGQLVAQDSQTLAPTGPAQTEFHIFKPSAWPKGKYSVEISVDGAPAGRKDFEVR
ncbi:MAG: hypothetical protein ACREOU_16990 [Candidatus Eiseniibacteriota bacterium]